MNSRAACAMISMAAACFHAGLWAGVVVRGVAIQDLSPISTPISQVSRVVDKTPRIVKSRTFCHDADGGFPDSAFNVFSVAGNGVWPQSDEHLSNFKVRLLQAPVHGQITYFDEVDAVLGANTVQLKGSGLKYLPTLAYVGKDRAVIFVESSSRQYQITVNFWGMPFVSDAYEPNTFCKQQKFNLNGGAPQNVLAWMKNADLSASFAVASGAMYTS